MTEQDKEIKVIFPPGVVDHLVEEFGYEEAQKIIDEITQAAKDGSIMKRGRELSDEEIEELGLDLVDLEDFDSPQTKLH